MKNISQILFSLCSLLVFIFCQTFTGHAQTDRIGDFFLAGEKNAEVLTRAYLDPLPKGFGAGLNTGWFNSASAHSTLGFDIQIRGALAFIPSSDQSYNFNELDLTSDEFTAEPADSETSPLSPTAGGDDSPGPEIVVRDNDGNTVGSFRLPQGSGFHFTPAPMVQASVGLIANTDIIIRFVPEVTIDDYGDFKIRGIGLKHEINQWLPGGKLLPVDIAIMAGYNRINIEANLDADPPLPDPTTNYDNQKLETTFNTFTAKVLIGRDLPFISVYGGFGYETTTMDLAVTGNYPVPRSQPGGGFVTDTVTDPFSYSEDGANQFSLTGGLNFKLFIFNIFGEYTLAKYPVANAGIGFSFR